MTASQDMIRGRSNIVTLTNNSGGGLVAGDVCVQDTTADEKVTTTTSAASVLKVFIAAETIANGAVGKFYESGYCPLVNVSASATRGRFLFTHTVAKQAAENATYGAGAFGKLLKSGTTPSAIIYSATAQVAGTGTIGGSSGSTDNAVIRADGTGGSTVQSSAATIDDSGTVNIPTGQTYNINNTPHTHAGSGVTHTYYGYDTIGGSTVQMTAQRAYLKKITLASAGTLVNIGVYLIGIHNQIFDVEAAVYDDSSGNPRHIIASQHPYASRDLLFDLLSSGGGTLEARWYHIPVAIYLAAGDYWISVMTSSNSSFAPTIYYDGSGADKYYDSGGVWWADAGYYTVNNTTNKYSIRASVLS